ncbi:TetR/AcrR family transcriptional regulator [Woodsholea maritima]|uniref:TetR/AcrR family transcriptional regulator n=1 Tax=Woodsholea maritima TaxID=240237 RepID=UPI00037182E1|nr:TetR/AcrR family transcriptional regulator [Woodsholea maritima]
MSSRPTSKPARGTARDALLDAALAVFREKGYSATSVDDVCARAGVTKGAFFHHFKSKEELGQAAAEFWGTMTGEVFRTAPYHDPADPLERVLAYIDFRKALLQGEIAEITCVAGTMVQETYQTSPAIRAACEKTIYGHVETLVADIEAAREAYAITDTRWSAQGLAAHTQTVLQGAFIMAKARNDVAIAQDSVDHLRRYVEMLFKRA